MGLFYSGWIGLCSYTGMSPADSNHPVLHKVAHPYYVAPGLVREPANRAFSGRRRKSLRGLRFGGGAGVCLGWSAARDVGRIWAFRDGSGAGAEAPGRLASRRAWREGYILMYIGGGGGAAAGSIG